MVRKPRESSKDSFELIPEKANKLHDDRAYTCALASYGLMVERRRAITDRKPRHRMTDLKSMLKVRAPQMKTRF